MGCVDHIHKDFNDREVMQDSYIDVATWRDELLVKIFAASQRVNLKDTAIYNDRQGDLNKLLKACHVELQYLLKADVETAEYKRKLVGHKKNMERLYKEKLFLSDDKNVEKVAVESFWELIQNTKKSTLDKQKKVELLHPWLVD